MELPKDVYEYLTNFADDRDILNMLSVNKQFNYDDEIFRRVMQRKYPLLIRYRKENESWKSLFIRMVYYLSELKEKYGIPYIPTDGCDPKNLLDNNKETIYNAALECAIIGVHLDLVKLFIYKVKIAYIAVAIYTAAEYGKKNIVDYLLERNIRLINSALGGAAAGGQLDLMKYVIEKGASDYNFALLQAATSGQIEAAKYLLEKGANNLNNAIRSAEIFKQNDFVK